MYCPDPIPAELIEQAHRFASAWATHPARPRVPASAKRGWAELLNAWIGDTSLPLLVRRGAEGRGSVLQHTSGRDLVPTDNSPADWALSLALDGHVPSLPEVRDLLARDQIPVAMVLKRSEKQHARYHCTRQAMSLGKRGWKIAHLDQVGFGRIDLVSAPLDRLTNHFRTFMDPMNMFVVPAKWSGLGEIPEMAAAIRAADAT